MGIQFKGSGSSDSIDVSCGEPSESNAGCGVLQTEGKDGLEMVTSVDGSECKERRGKTSAVGVRNGPIGVTNRAQEVGKVANCIIGHGQQACDNGSEIRADEGMEEVDRMEFEGGGDANASF